MCDISERQSSYAGSHGDDSEIDLTLSQKSLDLELLVMVLLCPWYYVCLLCEIQSNHSNKELGDKCIQNLHL